MGDYSDIMNSKNNQMPITNSMTDLDNNNFIPEGTCLAPEGTNLAPEGTCIAPESTTLAPEGTSLAPEGTNLAPEGTCIAPESTTLAPEGTSLAPEGTNLAPDCSLEYLEDNTTVSDGSNTQSEEIGVDNFVIIDKVKYRKVRTLSSGSEADMFLVNDGAKEYALKVYKRGHSPNKKIYKFLDMLKGGDYVADLLSYGNIDGQEYELMPYFPLGSAANINGIKGNDTAVLNIVLKCALSLNKCHEEGFVHLDVKPANILITDTEKWDCVLCDFGISEVLDNGQALLTKQNRTPTYAAPEIYGNSYSKTTHYNIDGKELIPISPSADFYSLGMTAISLWRGESKLRKQEEKDMLLSKVAVSIAVPADMPSKLQKIVTGLLMPNPKTRWGYKQIVDTINGEENISTSESDYFEYLFLGNEVAHTKEELAACMINHIDHASNYLYHGYFSDFFKKIGHNDWAVQLDEITEVKFKRDKTLGVLAAVHYLNPFCDICLNSKVNSTGYSMTLESIAAVLNDVYIWKYVEEGKPDLLVQKGSFYPEVYNRLANSFVQYEGSYLQCFFQSKGTRFSDADRACTRYINDSHSQRRIAPKDDLSATQIAFMQVISAFGKTPEFKFRGKHDRFSTLKEFDDLHGMKEKADALNYGLKGWLAVQFFADPRKSMVEQYDFERQVQAYTEKIGAINSRNPEYMRYEYASKDARSILDSKKFNVIVVKTQGVIQTLISIVAVLLPLLFICIYYVGSAIECANLPETKFGDLGYISISYGIAAAIISMLYGKKQGCMVPIVIGVVVGTSLYFLDVIGPKCLWGLMFIPIIGLIASVYAIFFRYKLKVNQIKPGFEELVVEPLGYAYSLDPNERFDSSLNSISGSLYYEKQLLKDRRKAIIACFIVSVACFFGYVSLPTPTKLDIKIEETYENVITTKTNTIDDAVQEMSDK